MQIKTFNPYALSHLNTTSTSKTTTTGKLCVVKACYVLRQSVIYFVFAL